MPQNLPAWTVQVGEELGTVMEVLLCEDVDVVVVGTTADGFAVVGGVAPVPGVRYQLASGSSRQVPAVTPFQPLARMRSK